MSKVIYGHMTEIQVFSDITFRGNISPGTKKEEVTATKVMTQDSNGFLAYRTTDELKEDMGIKEKPNGRTQTVTKKLSAGKNTISFPELSAVFAVEIYENDSRVYASCSIDGNTVTIESSSVLNAKIIASGLDNKKPDVSSQTISKELSVGPNVVTFSELVNIFSVEIYVGNIHIIAPNSISGNTLTIESSSVERVNITAIGITA